MFTVFSALIPDALVILAGVGLRRVTAADLWVAIDRLNYIVLYPALLFRAASASPPGAGELLAVGFGVWCVVLTGFTLGGIVRRMGLGPERFLDFAGLWQTAWRFNSAVGLIAVQALPDGAVGLMSVAIGFAVPLANILAVGGLTRGNALSFGRSVRLVALNPFLLASLGGLIVAMTGFPIPAVIDGAITRIAQAALPLALLSVGAALSLASVARMTRFDMAFNGIKLLILPAVTWTATGLIGMDDLPRNVLTLFAALPTASASHVLAAAFGADRALVARMVAQSTLLGCLTLPFWIALVAG
ncbi:hypothetical protein ATO6_03080 [Oceanicola sp. 22II-s10i]|uniref:AEC family transporter n=1 Tax=Oceanicola sp. 22II-s10i TaxID=1317116 RepID=UPI000B523580|nr:AEC family transporter [Oceanicola sp. 22II-s10i]OWU85887.1 hypothetical protein ATO6_03080 [Oceanicola sp. 22II-s10i]